MMVRPRVSEIDEAEAERRPSCIRHVLAYMYLPIPLQSSGV